MASTGVWVTATHTNGMRYHVLLPDNYDPNQPSAVLLYLHPLQDHAAARPNADQFFNTTEFRSEHPAIIVVPELPDSGEHNNWGGVSDDVSDGERRAVEVLRQVLADYNADTTRVYVTGDSMGGIGTWEMMIDYNAQTGTDGRIFAAGMPFDGAVYNHGYPTPNPAVIQALEDVPVWAVHGADDGQVPTDWDRAVDAAMGPEDAYRLTLLPGVGHGSWWDIRTHDAGGAYMDWLFAQDTDLQPGTPPTDPPPVDPPPPPPPPVDPPAPPTPGMGFISWDRDHNWYWRGAQAQHDAATASPPTDLLVITETGICNAVFSKEQHLAMDATMSDWVRYNAGDGRLTIVGFGRTDVFVADATLQAGAYLQSDGAGGSVLSMRESGGVNDCVHFVAATDVRVQWV